MYYVPSPYLPSHICVSCKHAISKREFRWNFDKISASWSRIQRSYFLFPHISIWCKQVFFGSWLRLDCGEWIFNPSQLNFIDQNCRGISQASLWSGLVSQEFSTLIKNCHLALGGVVKPCPGTPTTSNFFGACSPLSLLDEKPIFVMVTSVSKRNQICAGKDFALLLHHGQRFPLPSSSCSITICISRNAFPAPL